MLMKDKKGLIMGVANDRSIAWGIAKSIAREGGHLAFTYQGEALKKRVLPLAQSVGSDILIPCDVTDVSSITKTFEILKNKWGNLDFLVHGVAFSNKDELKGKYYMTSLENFNQTMHISCYSFTEVCRLAEPIMNKGGSILTLTYYGAEQVMPHYNVMGIAKAALEASVRYLAVDLGEKNIRNQNIRMTGKVTAINLEAMAKYIPGMVNRPNIILCFRVRKGASISVNK